MPDTPDQERAELATLCKSHKNKPNAGDAAKIGDIVRKRPDLHDTALQSCGLVKLGGKDGMPVMWATSEKTAPSGATLKPSGSRRHEFTIVRPAKKDGA